MKRRWQRRVAIGLLSLLLVSTLAVTAAFLLLDAGDRQYAFYETRDAEGVAADLASGRPERLDAAFAYVALHERSEMRPQIVEAMIGAADAGLFRDELHRASFLRNVGRNKAAFEPGLVAAVCDRLRSPADASAPEDPSGAMPLLVRALGSIDPQYDAVLSRLETGESSHPEAIAALERVLAR